MCVYFWDLRPVLGRLRAGGERATEDKTVGWHHRLNGHEFEQTPGDSEGQGSLACCSPWGHRVRHDLATEQQLTCASDPYGCFCASFLNVLVTAA